MLIIALVLAVIGLAALVTAVVTSNEVIAWVCIGASVIGVLLLIVDALRSRRDGAEDTESEADTAVAEEVPAETPEVQDYPDEVGDETPVDEPATGSSDPDDQDDPDDSGAERKS